VQLQSDLGQVPRGRESPVQVLRSKPQRGKRTQEDQGRADIYEDIANTKNHQIHQSQTKEHQGDNCCPGA